MPSVKKNVLKQLLRDECLPALSAQWKYFSHETIRHWLMRHKICHTPTTLNRYLVEMVDDGMVFSAGRGWYSSLAKAFTLNREPVSSLVQELNQTFPLLDFYCWSTQQINPYLHHLLGKFALFVQTDSDALGPVFEFLRNAGYDAHLNPTAQEKKRFTIRDKTVVVRRSVAGAPKEAGYATIESILVDLYLETKRLQLMDLEDFRSMARKAVSSARVAMAALIAYSERREQPLQALFDDTESIISGFFKNPGLVDYNLDESS